jgi:hypothetical protein
LGVGAGGGAVDCATDGEGALTGGGVVPHPAMNANVATLAIERMSMVATA